MLVDPERAEAFEDELKEKDIFLGCDRVDRASVKSPITDVALWMFSSPSVVFPSSVQGNERVCRALMLRDGLLQAGASVKNSGPRTDIDERRCANEDPVHQGATQ